MKKQNVPPTQKPKPSHPARPNEEFNAGVAQAKKRILRYLRSLRTSCDPIQDLEGAIAWIEGMAKRSAKKPGGAGRK